ncbi:MAG TPA: AprI/Inh family metalloprotease inhibitor [Rhizomicrobium sp.]|jgi:hypothetical protein|nr:AprI/Inh family metalloprotease inhibitor [Rhizomicrobium sp.]
MLKHRSLSATALTFFFLLAGMVGAAHADVAGPWKLTTGGEGDCALTLGADGTAQGCAPIAKYKVRGQSIAFYAANGDVISVLKAKGDAYEGNRQGDNHKMTLSH